MSERPLPSQLLGQLATFVVVAETLNFRQASEVVGRSQPAVSAHIQQLENYLGVTLLSRTTRHVRLTRAGSELLERGRKILNETRRLVGDMQAEAGLLSGKVVASFSPTIAVGLTPRVLIRFAGDYPGIRVQLREELGPEMLQSVLRAEADIGIGPYSNVPEALTFQPLFDQEFFLIVRADHPIVQRAALDISDLASLDVLCSSIGSTARALLEDALREAGISVNTRYEALHYPTLYALAASGFGCAVMPLVDQDLLGAMNLAAVPFRGSRLYRSIGLITRRDEAFPPPVAAFVDAVKDAVARHGLTLGLGQRAQGERV
ncbi:MAG: LysR family transcriptional regulator [Rhodobacter sp.]|nr:LysR family transcriptional regulator [Paracoccaceae bacterium]MCC0077281.1 LysR family transcriptional regulator [Rhodobacter sp.]